MRKPTLHTKFDIPNNAGISGLLSHHAKLTDVIQHTSYNDVLDVITSGAVPPNPSELIQSEIMPAVLTKLREHYDVIILDTPPVGLVTDARVLMHLSDINLYVTRAEYSKKEYIRNIEKLSLEDISRLGIILNDFKADSSGYGYGYGYGYYEEDNK